MYAILAAAFYTLFNYFAGTYTGNAITGKVVGSYLTGIACLGIHCYQKWAARKNLSKQTHAVNEYIRGVHRKKVAKNEIRFSFNSNDSSNSIYDLKEYIVEDEGEADVSSPVRLSMKEVHHMEQEVHAS